MWSKLPGLVMAVCLLSPLPAAAQSFQAFGEPPALALVVPSASDPQVAAWLTTLDRLLPAAGPASGESADQILGSFVRRVQAVRLSGAQESRIVAHLDRRAASARSSAVAFRRARLAIQTLTVGKKAPEIAGSDMNGVGFRLSDYHGQVVALVFSAEWCGLCRTLFPYERLMVDLYKNWPLAVLGVEGGSSIEAARRLRTEQGLTFRSWWDGPQAPITASWYGVGLPAVYLIDGEGTIRFIDTRYEDLLKGARQLLTEHMARADAAAKSASLSKR